MFFFIHDKTIGKQLTFPSHCTDYMFEFTSFGCSNLTEMYLKIAIMVVDELSLEKWFLSRLKNEHAISIASLFSKPSLVISHKPSTKEVQISYGGTHDVSKQAVSSSEVPTV